MTDTRAGCVALGVTTRCSRLEKIGAFFKPNFLRLTYGRINSHIAWDILAKKMGVHCLKDYNSTPIHSTNG